MSFKDRQFKDRYEQRWYGKYRAFVRDNHDPERRGRIRMEIPSILGVGNWSEWATPCFPYGGNDDMGTFMVPDEGASVWAEFEGGDPALPIWVGVWIAKSNPGEQPEESKRMCDKATCEGCEDAGEHSRKPDDTEHKQFHGHPEYYCPRVRVLMKTETGHTILADDKDGKESIRVIDRGGQSVTFRSPIKPEKQKNNELKRGVKDALLGTQLSTEKDVVEDDSASIEIVDLAGQKITLRSKFNEETISIESRDPLNERWQRVTLDNTVNNERVQIQGKNGAQEITIDSATGNERITIRDKAGSVVVLDAAKGNILIDAAHMVIIN